MRATSSRSSSSSAVRRPSPAATRNISTTLSRSVCEALSSAWGTRSPGRPAGDTSPVMGHTVGAGAVPRRNPARAMLGPSARPGWRRIRLGLYRPAADAVALGRSRRAARAGRKVWPGVARPDRQQSLGAGRAGGAGERSSQRAADNTRSRPSELAGAYPGSARSQGSQRGGTATARGGDPRQPHQDCDQDRRSSRARIWALSS